MHPGHKFRRLWDLGKADARENVYIYIYKMGVQGTVSVALVASSRPPLPSLRFPSALINRQTGRNPHIHARMCVEGARKAQHRTISYPLGLAICECFEKLVLGDFEFDAVAILIVVVVIRAIILGYRRPRHSATFAHPIC